MKNRKTKKQQMDEWYETNKDHIDWSTKEARDKFRCTTKWTTFSKQMRNKHKECQCCTLKSKNLNVHHLTPKKYDILEEERFAVVCHNCHRTIESLSKKLDRSRIPDWWKQFLSEN
jgi:hypothetical protein